MYAVQKDVWHITGLEKNIIEQLMRWSNNLFNVGTYESRQRYFKDKGVIKYPHLYKIVKTHENYGLLYSQLAQQSLKSVAESFSCFRALEKLAEKWELNQKPRLPKYRTSGGMYQISYPGQALKIVGNQVRLPLGNKGKEHFGTDNIIRKSKVATDSIIQRVGRGLLTNPLRIKLWVDSSPKVGP